MWSEAREDYGKPWTTRDDDEKTIEESKEKEKLDNVPLCETQMEKCQVSPLRIIHH